MLAELLKRISAGGSFTSQSLALEFGVSKELIEAMLADLGRTGYLQSAGGCEDGACGLCGASALCHSRGRRWIPKGE